MSNTLEFHNSNWVILQMTITRYLTNINVLLIFIVANSVVVLCTKLFPLILKAFFLCGWIVTYQQHNEKHFYYKKASCNLFFLHQTYSNCILRANTRST